jgi:hypothetical protein
VKTNLTRLNERNDLIEEALSLSEINADSVVDTGQSQLDSGKLKILMEKNRWTIDFGTEVKIYFDIFLKLADFWKLISIVIYWILDILLVLNLALVIIRTNSSLKRANKFTHKLSNFLRRMLNPHRQKGISPLWANLFTIFKDEFVNSKAHLPFKNFPA